MTREDLQEVVTREEVERELENLRESWRVVHAFWQRLEHQKAPDGMLGEVRDLLHCYQELHGRLTLLTPFFPRGTPDQPDTDE